MLWVLVLSSDNIAAVISGKEELNNLEVRMLDFEDGKFEQIVSPTLSDPIQANWSAAIFQNDDFICGGGGAGTYKQRSAPLRLKPDDWTGGDCSEMILGEKYLAEASWLYRTKEGEWKQISASFTFTYKAPSG